MAHDAYKLHIVRSDGRTLDLGDGTYWVLAMNKMGDWLDLDYTVSTSANVLTDGSTVVDKRVEEKDRTISATYWGKDRKGVRDQVIAFFNPRHSFEAHLTYFGRTRWCEGEQIGFDLPIVDERTPPTLTWTLLCPDPYLRGEDIHDETMRDASPFFTFPFRCFLPGPGVSAGCVPSLRVYDGQNTVKNDGAIPTPFRIRAEFGGEIKSPTFRVNDRHVTVVAAFKPGDVLVIDFMASPPTVTVNGANAIQRCSRDSTFIGMTLDVGENLFTYEAESGDVNTMSVSMVRYDRYLGV